MGGSHTSIMRRTKQNAATSGVSPVVLGPLWGPLWPWASDMPILELDEVIENKKTVLHADIFIVRRTKKNATTLGGCLIIFGPPWGPL